MNAPRSTAAAVTANSPGGGTPTGQVTFMDGSTALGTETLSGGMATLPLRASLAGTHSITVVYGGDTNFLSSTSTALKHNVKQDGTTTAVIFLGQSLGLRPGR